MSACDVRASLKPDRDIAALRVYLRLCEPPFDHGAAHLQHMQKTLTLMSLQLHHVVSDGACVTGLKIFRAIAGGQRDPALVARMSDVRRKATRVRQFKP